MSFFSPKLSFAKKAKFFLNLEKIENLLKKEYLPENNAFNLLKSIVVKVGKREIFWWQPAVLYW